MLFSQADYLKLHPLTNNAWDFPEESLVERLKDIFLLLEV